MKKIEIASLASAVAQVSNNGLEPKKGLKLYRFYQSLKAVQTELSEFEQKLMKDYDIKEENNDAELWSKFHDALNVLAEEDVDIKVEPFLTEEEVFKVFGSSFTMKGIELLISMGIAEEKKD